MMSQEAPNYQADIDTILDALGSYVDHEPNIVAEGRERFRGQFPPEALCPPGESHATIYYDAQTYEDLRQGYCDSQFTPEILDVLYKEGGVVRARLHDLLELEKDYLEVSDLNRIVGVHDLLSSPDGLSRAILDAADDHQLSDADARTLLLSNRENWLANPATLNGLRFQLGVTFIMHGQGGESMKDITQRTMLRHLVESLQNEEKYRQSWVDYQKYRQTQRALGQKICEQFSPHGANPIMEGLSLELEARNADAPEDATDIEPEKIKQLFTSSLPLIEVAGSFPMSQLEVINIAEVIIANRQTGNS